MRYIISLTVFLLSFACFAQTENEVVEGEPIQDNQDWGEAASENEGENEPSLNGEKTAFVFKWEGEIFDAAERRFKRALKEADERGVDYVMVELNTYGGRVDIADRIHQLLLGTKATTIVYINTNAASAGALLSISCDSIYMAPASQIGAATVVSAEGQQAPDKYQSYMRATMRSTAESQNRDPLIAEAMVDDRVVIAGIIDSGRTLTFTTQEAIEHGYCEGMFGSSKEVLEHLQLKEGNITQYTTTGMDGLMDWLLHPALTGALMVIMFAGVYFELQTPGVGFPLMASVAAALLYFAPHYLEGMAQNWEILLFIVGLLLLAAEVFVIPGFGVAGVLGIACMVVGLAFSQISLDIPQYGLPGDGTITFAFFSVIVSLLASLLLLFAFEGSLMNSAAFGRMSLETTQKADEGYSIKGKDTDLLLGRMAEAATDLRISGKIVLDGIYHDAITRGEYIEKGQGVEIIENRGNYYVVRST